MDTILYQKSMYNLLPDGWMNKEEISGYWNLLDIIPDNSTIVECGNYQGRSICSVAPQLIRKNIKIICIDNNHYDYLEKFKLNITKYRISDQITIITKDIIDAINTLDNESIDLVYWDVKNIVMFEAIQLFKMKFKHDTSIFSGQNICSYKELDNVKTKCFTTSNQTSIGGLWYAFRKDFK